MVPYTKDKSKEISDTAKANSITVMADFMTETGKLDLWTDMVLCTMVEGKLPMKVTGKMISSMAKESFIMKSLSHCKQNSITLTLIVSRITG